jgi:hypothetical protein
VPISLQSSTTADRSSEGGAVVFDRATFEASTMHDAGLQAEVLGLFRTQLGDVIRQLADGLPERDWRFVAHTLRGTAVAVGAFEIATIAEGWEAGQKLTHCTLDQARSRFEDAVETGFFAVSRKNKGAA